jgi:hypothetical protein
VDNKKRVKRWAALLAAAAVLAVLVVVPSLLSLPSMAPLVLAAVNRHVSGHVEVQRWSLGWLTGVRCENLRYQDIRLGLRVEAPRLASDKGLLALLLAPSYLGKITLDQPRLLLAPVVEPPAQASAAAGPLLAATPWWDRMSLRVAVNGGRVAVGSEETSTREIARDVDLEGSLAMGTVNYGLTFRSSQGQGSLRAEGFVNLPAAGQPPLATLISRTEVEVRDLELAGFLDFAAARMGVPRGRGVLSGTCLLKTTGIDNLELRGDFALAHLQLSGGFFSQDQPTFEQLQFTVQGSRHPVEGWRLTTLALRADPLRFEASGRLDRQTVDFKAGGALNLPAMAAQLPHLLAIHPQTTLQQGTIDFSLQARGTPAEFALTADCHTDRVEAVHDGRPVVWDTPLNLAVDGQYGPTGVQIDRLQAHGPYFEASGRGGGDDFSLRATADLDHMFAQLASIFALNVQARGRAELSVSSRAVDTGGYRLESLLKVGELALNKGRSVLLPSHDLSLAAMIATAPDFFRTPRLRSLRVEGSAWPGTFVLEATDVQTPPLQGRSEGDRNCSLQGTLDLQRLSRIIDAAQGAPLPFTLQGQCSFAASGQWTDQRMRLNRLEGRITPLVIASPAGPLLEEPQVRIGLQEGPLRPGPVAVRNLLVAENWQELHDRNQAFILVDGAAHRLEMQHLRLQGATRAVDAGGRLDNWQSPQEGVAVQIRGESEAALLADICRRKGWMAPEMGLKGWAQTSLAWRNKGSETIHDLDLLIEPCTLSQGRRTVFSDPRLALSVTLRSEEEQPEVVNIPALTLRSVPVALEGTGLFHNGRPPVIELQGRLTPDYGALAPLWRGGIGRDAVLSGTAPGTFVLSAPFILPLNREQVTLAAQLPLDALRFRSMELRSLTVPVELNQGILRAEIAAPLDGGTVTLRPQWQWDDRRSTMTLASTGQVLRDVPLKRPLLEGLLGRIHPLFGTLAQPEGTVSLRLDDFSWSRQPRPKDNAGPEFAAVIDMEKMHLKASGTLRTLLDTAGLEKKLRLQERELVCEGREGRISCAPLHLLAGDREVVVSGSMDMNGALNYRAQLPLTGKLAEQANIAAHGEATVEAEITGSRSAPVFDRQALMARLSERLAAAQAPQVEGEGPPAEGAQPAATVEP